MHGGIRKGPEWVCLIRQKVGSGQRIFAGSDGFTTGGTVSPSSFDPIHDCKLAQSASRCPTDRASAAATSPLGHYVTFP
jgi:hypothetical protein